ncbi:MAG TPA: hypothetical protein VHX20_09675 [Terracidiphilus sp.]|nr:hypothetical protein [Terracidiphilus sp.]
MRYVEVEPEKARIDKALEDVLAGYVFRSSRQCQALLRYIVEHSKAHREEMLRERVIGANVFGRAPDYDTGNDPVVRSRAAELRKRLAQHYMRPGASNEAIRIEIPIGSYRAVFEMPEVSHSGATLPQRASECDQSMILADGKSSGISTDHEYETSLLHENSAVYPVNSAQEALPQELPSKWTRTIAAIAVMAVLVLGVGLLAVHQMRGAHQRPSDLFWAPVMETQYPILIIMGANRVYRINNDFMDRYRAEHHIENNNEESFIDLKKGEMIDESELRKTEQIGFGDVAAAARVASMLTRFNKRYDLRYGGDIAVTDFQSSPSFLIGGFSNIWTLEVMRQLRFQLEGYDRIVDTKDTTRSWRRKSDPGTFAGDDYVVISRLIESETGNFVIAIGGIDTYSNQAAANFLDDPDRLDALLKTLPAGWERKNMQIILHTDVVKDVPTVVNVEAWDVR